MMRGIDDVFYDAFYRTDPEHGFDSMQNISAARMISKEVQRLLKDEFDLEAGSVPDWLDRGGILFGLRCLSGEDLRRQQVDPVEPDEPKLPAAPPDPAVAEEQTTTEMRTVGDTQQITQQMSQITEIASDNQAPPA
jgi:hypothetical protein